jgi:hypothetical protein
MSKDNMKDLFIKEVVFEAVETINTVLKNPTLNSNLGYNSIKACIEQIIGSRFCDGKVEKVYMQFISDQNLLLEKVKKNRDEYNVLMGEYDHNYGELFDFLKNLAGLKENVKKDETVKNTGSSVVDVAPIEEEVDNL